MFYVKLSQQRQVKLFDALRVLGEEGHLCGATGHLVTLGIPGAHHWIKRSSKSCGRERGLSPINLGFPNEFRRRNFSPRKTDERGRERQADGEL